MLGRGQDRFKGNFAKIVITKEPQTDVAHMAMLRQRYMMSSPSDLLDLLDRLMREPKMIQGAETPPNWRAGWKQQAPNIVPLLIGGEIFDRAYCCGAAG
jgi:hypothetical protein